MTMTTARNGCPYTICKRLCVHRNCDLSSVMQQNFRLVAFPQPCAHFLQSKDLQTFMHDVQLCAQCSVCIRWINLCNNFSRLKSLTDITHETFVCSTHFVNGEGPTEVHPYPLSADMDAEDEEVDPLMIKKEESNDSFKEEPQDIELNETIEVENFVSDHAYSCSLPSDQQIVRSSMILRSLGLELLDQQRSVKYDGESLSVYLFKEHLAEKACVLDREFKMNIFLGSHQICPRNFFWKKYPNVWNENMDFGSFIDDLFDNWHFCKPFANNKRLLEATIIALNADKQEHRYRFDVISKCPRSHHCTFLSTKRVCYYCHELETYLESGSRSSSCNYELQATPSRVKKKLTLQQRQQLYDLKKNSDRVCQNLLDKILVHNSTDPIADMVMIFYNEVENARTAKPVGSYEWNPLMIEWCTLLYRQSEDTYLALGRIFKIPSSNVLNKTKKPPGVGRNGGDFTTTGPLYIRKDLFEDYAISQPSQSSSADERSLEAEEWDYYRGIEMAEQLPGTTEETM